MEKEARGERGRRSLLKKLRKTFIHGIGDGFSLCKSDCAPIWFRPVHEKIVRERLPMGSAFYGERLRPFVYYVVVEYRVGDRSAYNIHRL